MRSERWLPVVLLCAVVVGGFLRFRDLGAESLWLDELFSVRAATREDWAGLVDEVRQDVHPPLYFALLKAWIAVAGVSEGAVRAPSAAFGTLSILAVFMLGRRLWGAGAGVAGACLVAVAPFVVALDREARGNALMSFLAVVSTAACTGTGIGARVLYAVSAGLMLWTHAFGFAVLAAHGLWSAFDAMAGGDRKRFRGWLAGAIGALVVYLPWASTLIAQTRTFVANPWYVAPAGDTLGWLVPVLTGGAGPAVFLALGLLVLYARGDPGSGGRLLPAAVLGIVLLPQVASMAWVPLLRDRNVLPLVPITLSAAGAGLAAVPGGGIALVAAAAATSAVITLRDQIQPQKEQWREAAAFVRKGWQAGDQVDATHPNLWRHYLPEVDDRPPAAARTWVVRAHEDLEGAGPTELGELVEEAWFRGARVQLRDRAITIVPLGAELGPPMWQGDMLHYYWNQSVRSATLPMVGTCRVGLIGRGDGADGEPARLAVRLIVGDAAVVKWDVDLGMVDATWWSPEIATGGAAIEIEFMNDGAGIGADGAPADRNVHLRKVMYRCG